MVTEVIPKRMLVPMDGFGWLLSKTAFCNRITFNQFTGYIILISEGLLVADGHDSLIIGIPSISLLLLLFDGHGSHPVCSLEILNFKVCPGFLGEEQLRVHFKVPHLPVKVDKW